MCRIRPWPASPGILLPVCGTDLGHDSPYTVKLLWDLGPSLSVTSPLRLTRHGSCLFDRRSCVAQARLKLMSSADSPASAIEIAGDYRRRP